ncbi:MAG: RIP metalloprotease RseP [Acidobacteria bacterium]|nr:MAG: RIP metalloprotease RseP [Acidobacteriota bacterium]
MLSNIFRDAGVIVVVLPLMIFVHELGHFVAAKAFGVRVLTFSFGFGKRLFGVKRGDTDYRVSLIPLGGYVKMAGDDPSQPRQGDPREYLAKPRLQRFVIVIMGPAMNVAMAIALLTLLNHFSFEKSAYEEEAVRVGLVDPNSPAATVGLKPGDLIVQCDDLTNPNWEQLLLKIATSPNETLPIEIERGGKRLSLTITPQPNGNERTGYIGVRPVLPAVVQALETNMPAARAGLEVGDRILALDGTLLDRSATSVVQRLQEGKGKEVTFTVLRQGKQFDVQLKPVYAPGGKSSAWRIGAALTGDFIVRQLPWGEAVGSAAEFCVQNSLLTFVVLEKVLTRKMSPDTFSGPIGMAEMSGEAFSMGFLMLVQFVAVISLQLGIFNLLPVPILDGGAIVLLLIEGILRRDLSLQVKERVIQVGFVFLLLLAVFVTYNDIMKTIRTN